MSFKKTVGRVDLSQVDKLVMSEDEFATLSHRANKATISGMSSGPVKETYAQICEKHKLDPTTGYKLTISEEQLEAFRKANAGIYIKDNVLHIDERNINKLEENIVLPHPSTLFEN